MQVIVSENYTSLSIQAAALIASFLKESSDPLLCAASGDSPIGIYEELCQLKEQGIIDTSNWAVVSLDEWVGLNQSDKGSCAYSIERNLTKPLGIEEGSVCFFDGRNSDTEVVCREVESFIDSCNGMDVAILGLGMNGHIGLNEPGTAATVRTHVSTLEPLTKQVGQKYFDKPMLLQQGITLGIGNLMEAKHLILVVSGIKKADIVKQLLEGPVTESLPASLFLSHPSIYIFLDKEAASKLQ
jgi:glucosamine-6-phosphate isomerase